MLLLTAQTMVAMRNPKLEAFMTTLRPYSSLSGAIISGPIVKGRIYADTAKLASDVLSLWNSRSSSGTPGANMVGTRDMLKVTADTSIMMKVLRVGDQFRGVGWVIGPFPIDHNFVGVRSDIDEKLLLRLVKLSVNIYNMR